MKTTALALIATAAAAAAQVANVRTVPTYDPAVPNPNQVDVKLPSVAWYNNFVANVAASWNANRGGVINFDSTNTVPWPSVGTNLIRASYGVAFTQTLNVGVPTLGHISNHSPILPISGRGDMMTQSGGAMSLSLNATTGPIRQAGLTVLQHPTMPQRVYVNFIQSGGPSIAYTFFIPAGPSNRDTFCGATATVPGGITHIRITDVNALTGGPFRLVIDDLAFVTRPGVIVANPGPIDPVPADPLPVDPGPVRPVRVIGAPGEKLVARDAAAL